MIHLLITIMLIAAAVNNRAGFLCQMFNEIRQSVSLISYEESGERGDGKQTGDKGRQA